MSIRKGINIWLEIGEFYSYVTTLFILFLCFDGTAYMRLKLASTIYNLRKANKNASTLHLTWNI